MNYLRKYQQYFKYHKLKSVIIKNRQMKVSNWTQMINELALEKLFEFHS